MNRQLLLALMAGALMAAPSLAEKNGFSLGAGASSAQIRVDGDPPDFEDFDENDTGYKIWAGYRVLKFLGAEASYLDFGSPSSSFDLGGSVFDNEISLKGWDVAAVGYLPLGIVDLYAKAGFFWWDADVRQSVGNIVDTGSASGSDPMYGIGVAVWLGQLSFRGEVELFDIADADLVYLITVGAAWTF